MKNFGFQFKMTHEDLNGENTDLTRYRLPGRGLLHMKSKACNLSGLISSNVLLSATACGGIIISP